MTRPAISLHNHTTWSDGETSVQEMVDEARRIGLEEVGFTDHYTLLPTGDSVEWSMPRERIGDYVEDVRSARRASAPNIRLGVEADFFPETVEELRKRLSAHPFDYVIGSVHFVGDFPVDSRAEDWIPLGEEGVSRIWRGYWHRIRLMAESGVFDVAAHLDLPKKFGFYPSAELTEHESAALKAIAESGMAIEINTNGWNLPCAEAYPSPRLLNQAQSLGISLIISSDAHHPRRLIENFDLARELAIQAGYIELSRFEMRRRTAYPL